MKLGRKLRLYLRLTPVTSSRDHTHSGVAKRTTLSGLSAAGINQALASALPPVKRRTFIALKEPKEKLLEAFKIINAERTLEARHTNDLKSVEGRIKAPSPAPETPAQPVNAYEAAFAPLMAMLAQDVSAILMPKIEILLRQHSPAQISAPTAQEAGKTEEAPTPESTVEPRKPMVGVVEMLPEQANNLRKALPELQLICVESDEPNRVRSLQNCKKVLGMAKFMSHSIENSLKKLVRDRYVRVDGGPETIKRRIQILQASGALQA